MDDYRCKICGASYVLGSMLNAHIEKTHYPTIDARTDAMKVDALLRKAESLEARLAVLEAEIETLKAGK